MRVRPVFDSAVPRRLGMVALTLYPFVLFAKTREESRTEFDRETLKHEMAHVRQARRYPHPVVFFVLYVVHFMGRFIALAVCPHRKRSKGRGQQSRRKKRGVWARCLAWVAWVYEEAYHGNPFEVEAYAVEDQDLDDDELDELLTVGAINIRCLRTGELRRVCRLCGIDADDEAQHVLASRRSMLRYLDAFLSSRDA